MRISDWSSDVCSSDLGIDPVPLLGERFQALDLLYNHGSVVFGLVYVHLPFMILPLYAALERLDKSYLEASLDLGAGQWRPLFSVMVPLTMPGISSGLIIKFIPALGAFLTPETGRAQVRTPVT